MSGKLEALDKLLSGIYKPNRSGRSIVFNNDAEKLEYVRGIKSELDGASSKPEIAALWKRHYLIVGHKILGRLLIGKSPEDAIARRKGKSDEE